MGQVIKTRTITAEQLEALSVYCFAVNSVAVAEVQHYDADVRHSKALGWLQMCENGLKTAQGLIEPNLNRLVKEFGISAPTESEKNTIAMDLINVYLDHPSGEIPTLGEIKHKRNVIVRGKL